MSEKFNKPRLVDQRIKQVVNMSDLPFLQSAVAQIGDIKFEILFTEGQQYAGSYNEPIYLPRGKAWIKMKANIPAGKSFKFVFEKAEELKNRTT